MKTLYASVCTLLLISFGCKPEHNVSQSSSPMLSTSTPCWAVWTSLDSTIWDYMQHPAEPDDEYANELMYATAMAIQEASCEHSCPKRFEPGIKVSVPEVFRDGFGRILIFSTP